MNMHIWVAANETNCRNEHIQIRSGKDAGRSKDHRSREEDTPTGRKDGTVPASILNSRRYRALASKWAMGTFPPMSNSKLVEEAGTFAVDAFNTVQERLSQDELTAEQKEETKAALGKRSRSRKDESITTVEVFFSQREFFLIRSHTIRPKQRIGMQSDSDGKVAPSVCRCVGNFQNKINFLHCSVLLCMCIFLCVCA